MADTWSEDDRAMNCRGWCEMWGRRHLSGINYHLWISVIIRLAIVTSSNLGFISKQSSQLEDFVQSKHVWYVDKNIYDLKNVRRMIRRWQGRGLFVRSSSLIGIQETFYWKRITPGSRSMSYSPMLNRIFLSLTQRKRPSWSFSSEQSSFVLDGGPSYSWVLHFR